MVAFGGNLTGFNTINYFARNFDNILIGKVLGPGQLGFYSKAYELLMLPLRQLLFPMTDIIIPMLSRLQGDPARFREAYLKTITTISLVNMPIVAILLASSHDIILIVLGQKWIPTSEVFVALGLSGFIQPIYSSQGWLHIAIGRTDRMLRWGLIGSPIIVLSFVFGLPFGAFGVALAYSIAIYLITGPSLAYAGRPIGLKLWSVVLAVWRPFVSAVIGAILAWILFRKFSVQWPLLLTAVARASLMLICYLAMLSLLYRHGEHWRLMKEIVNSLLRRGSSKVAEDNT